MNGMVDSVVLFWAGALCDRSGMSVCFSMSIGPRYSATQIGDTCLNVRVERDHRVCHRPGKDLLLRLWVLLAHVTCMSKWSCSPG